MLSLKYFCRLQRSLAPILSTHIASKHTVDYSQLPKINESDLAEQFVRGSGPGGSAVNKNANCVVLTHIPTGTVIKCHISRCQDDNRKLARDMLIAKLDELLNGENSVAAQKKRIDEQKHKKTEYKKKKRAQLKEDWKKREGLA
ncbi:mitochondrial translation release factor in rescue [Bicyclus anynana]|uniref:Mitochondrial translation release factor in rescue n=1 Tax=Bicyclus anynana TaxID=110368 RepID=A0A6J1MP05_BICAN|nr:mitochondrial translation release factor in rescue [Bicyclus anynana]